MLSLNLNITTILYIAFAAAVIGILLYIWWNRSNNNKSSATNTMYDRGRLKNGGFISNCDPIKVEEGGNSFMNYVSNLVSSYMYPIPELHKQFNVLPNDNNAENKKYNITAFKQFGHEVFTKMIEKAGGLKENVRNGVKLSFGDASLDVDSYYDDGNYKIAVLWQDLNQISYPNHIFKSKNEFERYRHEIQEAMRISALHGVHVIEVPCTVDTCVNTDGGNIKVSNFSDAERRRNIKSFIKKAVKDYIVGRG